MCTNSTYNVHQMNRNGHGYVYKNQKYNESRFANITKKKNKNQIESLSHDFINFCSFICTKTIFFVIFCLLILVSDDTSIDGRSFYFSLLHRDQSKLKQRSSFVFRTIFLRRPLFREPYGFIFNQKNLRNNNKNCKLIFLARKSQNLLRKPINIEIQADWPPLK